MKLEWSEPRYGVITAKVFDGLIFISIAYQRNLMSDEEEYEISINGSYRTNLNGVCYESYDATKAVAQSWLDAKLKEWADN